MDAIFKRLYEDSVLGRITAEQFQTLSGSCTEEMAALSEKIPEREAAIQALREQVCGTGRFIALAKKYTDIQELTPELLRLFIRKIVVHEKDVKWSKHARQTDGGNLLQRHRMRRYSGGRGQERTGIRINRTPGRPCRSKTGRGFRTPQ